MTFKVWYTKQFDEGTWEGADAIEFDNLTDAWNCFLKHQKENPDDRNLMLTADGAQIA